MLSRWISLLKERLGMTKARPLGQASLSDGDSFDTLPTPWAIAQVEEEEDPKVV
jgi:hypothetical protein